jgi:hypothetical protein
LVHAWHARCPLERMIRKLPSGEYRLYAEKKDERAVQFFKRA